MGAARVYTSFSTVKLNIYTQKYQKMIELQTDISHVHQYTNKKICRLTVAHAAKRAQKVFSPLIVTNQTSVTEVQLGDWQPIFLGEVPVVEHIDAG